MTFAKIFPVERLLTFLASVRSSQISNKGVISRVKGKNPENYEERSLPVSGMSAHMILQVAFGNKARSTTWEGAVERFFLTMDPLVGQQI